MPKNSKTKYEYFPLYFKYFSFIKTRFKDWICGTIKSQLSAKIKLSLYSHYQYPTFKTPPELIGEFLPFSHHPNTYINGGNTAKLQILSNWTRNIEIRQHWSDDWRTNRGESNVKCGKIDYSYIIAQPWYYCHDWVLANKTIDIAWS